MFGDDAFIDGDLCGLDAILRDRGMEHGSDEDNGAEQSGCSGNQQKEFAHDEFLVRHWRPSQ
jgi:hypothetical protein